MGHTNEWILPEPIEAGHPAMGLRRRHGALTTSPARIYTLRVEPPTSTIYETGCDIYYEVSAHVTFEMTSWAVKQSPKWFW